MDVEKQVDYWKTGSQEDIEVAAMLCERRRYRHALFFAHLAIEKALKAHVARQTKEAPPKIHNLTRLAERAALSLAPAQREFLLAFDEYQLEGRYPDRVAAQIDMREAEEQFTTAERVRQWLISLL